MAFIQIVEFTSQRIEEIARASRQYRQDSEGRRTAKRSTLAVDRHNPSRYFVIAEFDSYVAAMEDANLSESESLADTMRALADGPPTFLNLEVIDSFS